MFNNIYRKRLYAVTVPSNKEYAAGTVPENKKNTAGTVPVNKKYAAGTLKKFKFPTNSPTPSKPPLVWPQKCQSFVQRLRGTLFPEGNQLSVNWVL